jgi:MHS family proline/betaine transporter-like MFS transporter
MMTHEHLVKESILNVINKHKKGILIGILFCALNSSAFYLLTVNFPVYFGQVLGIEYSNNLILTMFLLLLITLPLPFFGKLADKYNNKKMLIWSTIGMIILLYPLYYSIIHNSLLIMGIVMVFFSLLFTLLSALIPYILPDLFPTHVRFTCVGLSFNLVDAIVGGFTPAIVLYLLHFTGNQASFCWWLLLCSLASLIAFSMMKEPRHSNGNNHH